MIYTMNLSLLYGGVTSSRIQHPIPLSSLLHIPGSINLLILPIPTHRTFKLSFYLLPKFSAMTTFLTDIFPQHFYKLYRLFLTFLLYSLSNISSLPLRHWMIHSLIYSIPMRLWQLYHINYFWFLLPQKAIQLLIYVTVKFLFQPSFLSVVFLSPRILFSITVITSCLLSNPICIFYLVSPQFFSVSMSFVRCQHRI